MCDEVLEVADSGVIVWKVFVRRSEFLCGRGIDDRKKLSLHHHPFYIRGGERTELRGENSESGNGEYGRNNIFRCPYAVVLPIAFGDFFSVGFSDVCVVEIAAHVENKISIAPQDAFFIPCHCSIFFLMNSHGAVEGGYSRRYNAGLAVGKGNC